MEVLVTSYTTKFNEARQLCKRTVVIKKAIQALDDDERKLFLKEVALFHDLKHDNVVKLKGVCYKLSACWNICVSPSFLSATMRG